MPNLTTHATLAKALNAAVAIGLTPGEAADVVTQPSASAAYQVDVDAAERVLVARLSAHHRTVENPHADATLIDDAGDLDLDLIQSCGYSHCPHCGIHLSNGIGDFDGLVELHGEAEARKLQKREWSCLGCNGEWSTIIVGRGKGQGRSTPTRSYLNKSTVDGAVVVCWDIYAANPDIRRKDAIQMAVDKGVAFYTARTQYQKWFTAMKSSRKGGAK